MFTNRSVENAVLPSLQFLSGLTKKTDNFLKENPRSFDLLAGSVAGLGNALSNYAYEPWKDPKEVLVEAIGAGAAGSMGSKLIRGLGARLPASITHEMSEISPVAKDVVFAGLNVPISMAGGALAGAMANSLGIVRVQPAATSESVKSYLAGMQEQTNQDLSNQQ